MFAFQGLLLALLARATSGRGQLVDVSLLDSVAALLTYQASRYLASGDVPGRTGNRHMTIAPYDTFAAADGVLVLAVGNDSQWQRLCSALAQPHLAADPRFRTNALRATHYADLQPALATVLGVRPLADLMEMLRAAGVPCGAVRSIDDALADPQIVARAMVEVVDHPSIGRLPLLGVPTKLSDTPGGVRTPPPTLGQHTRAVLMNDLGLDESTVTALAARRVIGGSGLQDEPGNRG
jgi:crotonobetainyl-CoA:carnitine CoA-transferase CaiB-like acyl-CoA transferase